MLEEVWSIIILTRRSAVLLHGVVLTLIDDLINIFINQSILLLPTIVPRLLSISDIVLLRAVPGPVLCCSIVPPPPPVLKRYKLFR